MFEARIVLEIHELFERFPEGGTRPSKDVSHVGQASSLPAQSSFVADVENDACRDRAGGILPVPFLRAIFPGADDHVRDVLGVADIAGHKQPNLGERVESRTTRLLYW